jgi:hypothetical protein
MLKTIPKITLAIYSCSTCLDDEILTPKPYTIQLTWLSCLYDFPSVKKEAKMQCAASRLERMVGAAIATEVGY